MTICSIGLPREGRQAAFIGITSQNEVNFGRKKLEKFLQVDIISL